MSQLYLPLPWFYSNVGDDLSGGRFGNIISEPTGKLVAESVYEKDAKVIIEAMSAMSSATTDRRGAKE